MAEIHHLVTPMVYGPHRSIQRSPPNLPDNEDYGRWAPNQGGPTLPSVPADQLAGLPARVRLNQVRTLLQQASGNTWTAQAVVELLEDNHIDLCRTQGQPHRDFDAVRPGLGTAAVTRADVLNLVNWASANAGPEAA